RRSHRPRSPHRRRAARPRPSRTATDARLGGRLDQPRRGGGDPRGRQRTLPPVHDWRLGTDRQAPEHQARRPAVRASWRGPRARRWTAARPGRRSPAGPLRGDSGLIDDGRDPRPDWRLVARERLLRLATPIIGSPRVTTTRRVLDRFGTADGGLLAAGI